MGELTSAVVDLPVFNRHFWDGTFRCTRIGTGDLGGKARGLVFIKDLLYGAVNYSAYPELEINVPTMAVVATDFFDEFMSQNGLRDIDFEALTDARIGYAFQKADLPVELVGDLRALITQVHTPLAIRSSSLLEDALDRPFAGVYATKMIPNNQFDPDIRFRRLVEAVKFVYASAYFREAREYIRTTGRRPEEEKMAVIIQEVVGIKRNDRFYPDVSGVARSYNFYPMAPARPEEGVISLALGLGKTIVDGGISWTVSPSHPKTPPPFASVNDMLRSTQTEFWAVNMGKPPAYDPISEVEYLVHANLADAEKDEVLRLIASTYDAARDRLVPGVGPRGPRVLDFAPLLVWEQFPVAQVLNRLLRAAEHALNANVEIEFALTFQTHGDVPQGRLGLLQVRPMFVSGEMVEVSAEDMSRPETIVACEMAMGNGVAEGIHDIVYVKPDTFSCTETPSIAQELAQFNRELLDEHRPYVLIGFGRWGSSHFSLGIPVDWSQISGARAIIESTLPEMNVELSQGSHFFHNLASFRASYFMVPHGREYGINWAWLERQPVVRETGMIRHVRTSGPLSVKVDGRTGRGVIFGPR